MFRDFFYYLYKEEITSLGNLKMRLDALADAAKHTEKFVKEFSSKHQRLFQKVLHLFKKVLSSISAIFFIEKEAKNKSRQHQN